MGVVRVERTFQGERLDKSEEIHVYRVQCNALTDTCLTARDASGVPAYGAALGGGSTWVVTNKEVSRSNEPSPFFFQVLVHFSSPEFAATPPGSGKSNIRVSISGIEYTQAVYYDKDNNAIQSSSYESYDPPVEQTYYDEQIVVEYTTATLNTATIAGFRGKINSDTITMTVSGVSRSFAAHTLKIGNVQTNITLANDGNSYWSVSLPLIYRADTWQLKLPDMGYLEWDATLTPPDWVHIKDAFSDNVSSPQYLDGSGVALGSGSAVVFNTFDLYDAVAFSGLLSGI